MKPYDKLTRLGRLRRMRQLAAAALANYAVQHADHHLLGWARITLFRVRTDNLLVDHPR